MIFAAGSIWAMLYVQSVNATRIGNAFFYKQEDPDGSNPPERDLATRFEQVVAPVYKANLGSGWSSTCYEIHEVGVSGIPIFRQASTVGAGTRAGGMLNAAVVAVIATFTATGSHRGTGRSFISGLTGPQEKRNNLSDAGRTEMELIAAQLIAPLTIAGITFTPGRGPSEGVLFDPWVLADVRIPTSKLRPRRQLPSC